MIASHWPQQKLNLTQQPYMNYRIICYYIHYIYKYKYIYIYYIYIYTVYELYMYIRHISHSQLPSCTESSRGNLSWPLTRLQRRKKRCPGADWAGPGGMQLPPGICKQKQDILIFYSIYIIIYIYISIYLYHAIINKITSYYIIYRISCACI